MNNTKIDINVLKDKLDKMNKKKKKKKIVYSIILIIIVILLCILLMLIIRNLLFKRDINKMESIIKSHVEIVEVTTEPVIEEEVELPSDYWKYIDYNLISVDLNELKELNDETIGWIQVSNTNVNYPIVKHSNNEYYLNHQFDKTYNTAGWIFMDYRNDSIMENNKNTIIYGHGLQNKALFGTLKKTINESWYNNNDNLIIKTVDENTSYIWQIFSIYTFETDNDYIQTEFTSDEDYLDFIDLIKGRSIKDFGIELDENDKVLTLSTCYSIDGDIKLVIHAKLVKQS